METQHHHGDSQDSATQDQDLNNSQDSNWLKWEGVLHELQRNNVMLPKNFHQKNFDTYDASKITTERFPAMLKYLRGLVTATKKSVWISGPTGIGKTHLLNSVMLNIAWCYYYENSERLNGQIKFWNYSDLCLTMREKPNDFQLLHRLRSPRFMFIDDVGVSKSSDFIQEKFYSILNYRCENELPTFVTTNLNRKELQTEFTERLTSRIMESGYWLEIAGDDYRMELHQQNLRELKKD